MFNEFSRLVHSPLEGEKLLALLILFVFARVVVSTQSDALAVAVRRCTIGVFTLYLITRIVADGVGAPGFLISYAYYGLVTAGFVYAGSAVAFSASVFFLERVVIPVRRSITAARRRRTLAESNAAQQRAARLAEAAQLTQQSEEDLRKNKEQQVAAERQRREDEVRKKREATIEKVRFECRVFYDSLPDQVRDNFSLSEFDAYFSKFIGPHLTVQEIIERAAKLRALLSDRTNTGMGRFQSLQSIVGHFRQLQDEVSSSGLPQDVQESLIADLQMDQARAIREFREQS